MKITRLALAVSLCALAAIGVFRLFDDDKAPGAGATRRINSVIVTPARLLKPQGPAKGFVIYFSDAGGWNDDADTIARDLAQAGYAVAGIDTSVFLAQISQSRAACIHPVQPLMAVARKAQRDLGWPSYTTPALAGHGLGATIVYATLAQAVPGIFLVGISYDYKGFIPGDKPWCEANGYQAMRVTAPHTGWRPGATKELPTPWRFVTDGPLAEPLNRLISATPNSHTVQAASEERAIRMVMATLPVGPGNPAPTPSASFSDTPAALPARLLRTGRALQPSQPANLAI